MTSFGSHISGFLRTLGLARILALLAPLVLASCGDERFEWHQKMTVTVETPGGANTASSVIRVKSRYVGPETMGNEVFYGLQGEAVTMEIAPGRYLFALLNESFAELYYRSSPDIFANPKNRGEWLAEIPHKTEVVSVPADRYPLLVTFGDINDPKSVRRVDPDDLDAALGLCPDGSGLKYGDAPWRGMGLTWREWRIYKLAGLKKKSELQGFGIPSPAQAKILALIGVRNTSGDCHRLKQITLEITDDPVTEGRVEKVLGWLRDGTTLKKIWGELTSQQRDQLSNTNWKR